MKVKQTDFLTLSLNPSVYLNVNSTSKKVACHHGLWSWMIKLPFQRTKCQRYLTKYWLKTPKEIV